MKRRRKHGSGSVQMLGPTTAFLRWREHGKRPSRVIHDTTEELAHEIMDGIIEGLRQRAGRYTVEAFGDDWLKRKTPKRGDADSVIGRFNKHIRPHRIARVHVDELRAGNVRAWLDDLERGGVEQQNRRHCVSLLSAIVRDAVELLDLPKNVVRDVEWPPVPPTRRQLIATREQVERLAYDESLDPYAATIALMLVGFCLRPGELLGLRVEDAGERLLVWRSKRTTDTTKTGQPRALSIFGWGEVALAKWRRLRSTLRVKRYDTATSPWLVPVPRTWFQRRNRVGRLLAALGASHLHPHDLRGTGATHLLSGTWGPPWTIADVATYIGDSISTTQRTYAHVTATRHDELGKGIRVGYDDSDEVLISAVMSGRARCDSNARPLASEALGHPVGVRQFSPGDIPTTSRLARRYLEAVRDASPHAHDRGVELAAAVLRLEIADVRGEQA